MSLFKKRPKSLSSKCLKCQKFVYPQQNSICCDKCNKWLHLKCSILTKSEFELFCDPKNSNLCFFCHYCQNFPCGKCNLPVYEHHNSILCEGGCDKWFHLKCTNVSLKKYVQFNKTPEDSPAWFCNSCYIPPFSDLNNKDLFQTLQILDELERNTTKEISKCQPKKICSVCTRKVDSKKVYKALICKCCNSMVHRKCSGLKLSELNKLSPFCMRHWECQNCYSDKFPLNNITDDEVIKCGFNSNFDCSCSTVTENIPFRKNVLLELAKFNNKSDKYGPDPNNDLGRCFDLDLEFGYYTDHQFHKLVKSKKANNFSIFNTNIESLQCNIDRL